MSIESVMPSNHLFLCCPLPLLSISPSIRVFSNKSVIHIMWPEYWSFSFSISPFSEYSVLISFRMDWFDGSGLSTTCWDASDSGSGQVGIWPLSSSQKHTGCEPEIQICLSLGIRTEICKASVQFSSVAHSCLTLQPHEPQHARPPCPSPTAGVHPDPYLLSQGCHPTISSSVVPFSSHLQSFPALGSFQMSQLFTSGGQSIGVSASTSVLPMNTQDWSPFRWTGWISLQSKGLSRVFSSTTVQKHQCKAWGIIIFSAPMSQEGRYRDNGVRKKEPTWWKADSAKPQALPPFLLRVYSILYLSFMRSLRVLIINTI